MRVHVVGQRLDETAGLRDRRQRLGGQLDRCEVARDVDDSSKDGAPTPIWTAGGLNTPRVITTARRRARDRRGNVSDTRRCPTPLRHPRAEGPAAARAPRRAAARVARSRASSSSRAARTYHLLDVLKDEGFVVHLPEQRRYGLGVAAFELGSAYERQESLRWIAQTVLTRLVARPPTTRTWRSCTAATCST